MLPEIFTKETGWMTGPMARVNTFTRTAQPMLANGKMTNSRVKEKKPGQTAPHTMAAIMKGRNTATGNSFGVMDLFI